MESRQHQTRSRADLALEIERLLPVLQSQVSYLVPGPDGDDIVQQTALLFLEKRSTIHNAEAWLSCVARRKCLQHLRRQRRRFDRQLDAVLLDSLSEDSTQDDEQLSRELAQAIAHTPERCQQVLTLRYRLGLEAREIGAQLGYKVESVRKVASRCVAALSQRILGRRS